MDSGKLYWGDFGLAAWLSGQDVGLWPADFPCPAPDSKVER